MSDEDGVLARLEALLNGVEQLQRGQNAIRADISDLKSIVRGHTECFVAIADALESLASAAPGAASG
ncbi:MAG: hypothetical protein OES32_16005 [Acidobacteriota bacterium]|nr:hypothetical protein [Acidobacteriota bacterium]MDH3525080.1 hypothetical protein [Acidobacteriota bacterium]